MDGTKSNKPEPMQSDRWRAEIRKRREKKSMNMACAIGVDVEVIKKIGVERFMRPLPAK